MGLVQQMMGSMNLEGSGWGDVTSFWHLKGIMFGFSYIHAFSC